jgi:hypothetical protein
MLKVAPKTGIDANKKNCVSQSSMMYVCQQKVLVQAVSYK